MAPSESPFMRIPCEIRLMIYDYLFDDKGHDVLEIRNTNPDSYHRSFHHRTGYRIVGQGRSRPTTYRLVTDAELHTSILRVTRKIHEEASHRLYSNHMFGFGKDVEAIVPFCSDLTPQTRCLIPGMSLFKRGSVYCRDYDRCEWSSVCEYIKEHMQIRTLRLVVEGGRPSLGWESLPRYSVADFKTLSLVNYEPLEWVWELLTIKGIQKLDIIPDIHHCPPSHSSAMAFFAAFSSSISTDFADFLRMEMSEA
ncbi:hypothetical protein BP6252_01075 [Coleophoma cylindrospora]|uniref:DUF7730 domain-containing protein n=1 Tax=Coleophoma cylindrospora TaxID=1849047 RepID=A0A3D8SRV4_9HELO|nr:hypothetical protein BP6252_01075 [Coleophoma cylindrospora]